MDHDFELAMDRIRKATGARTQVQLAEILDIRQSSISDAKRRKSIPSDWLIKLYRSHGLNPEWVLDGQEPMYLREGMTPPSAMEEPGAYTPEKPRSRTVVVSAMSGSALAGEPWREKPLEMITIPEPFNRPQLITVRMDGSGMEPLIRRGAYIGLDRSQRRIISGEIYGVDLPLEGLAIKRIFHDAENARLILRSENPLQQDQFMPVEGSSDRIVGRVIWVLQEI